jgi:choline transport protein
MDKCFASDEKCKLTVSQLITWETVLAIFSQSFDNGGPAGAVYGFIIAWSSTLSVYTVISELASMAPIAGGQYETSRQNCLV